MPYNIISAFFFFSSLIGKHIVVAALSILNYILFGLSCIASTVSALSEAIQVFCSDLNALYYGFISSTIVNAIGQIPTKIVQIFWSIMSGCVAVCQNVCWSTWRLMEYAAQALQLLRELVILFGEGMWFVLTLLPYFTYNIFLFITFLFELMLENLFQFYDILLTESLLERLYHFVFDVPFEAVAGLVSFVGILGLILLSLNTIKKTVRAFDLYVKAQLNRLRSFRKNTKTDQKKNLQVDEDRVCVVCNDDLRCILLIPCRHVPMCLKCSNRIVCYSNACPICRQSVSSKMKIYL